MGVSLTVTEISAKGSALSKDSFRRSGDKVIYDWLRFSLHSFGSTPL